MASIRDIKRQIKSVQNTQKITNAMQMVAAAKLRKANEAINKSTPYSKKMRDMIADLSEVLGEIENPFFAKSEDVDTIGLVIVSSDRGLCGAFNSGINKLALEFRREHPDKKLKLYMVGKKSFDFLKNKGFDIAGKWIAFGGAVSFESSKEVCEAIVKDFLDGAIQEVHFLYNKYVSTSTQLPTVSQFLPLELLGSEEASGDADDRSEYKSYLFEPKPAELLNTLVPKFLNFSVHKVLLESVAGENGSRMVAMDNATRNAAELVRKLQINYNKARQSAITTELLDIVNGAEALK